MKCRTLAILIACSLALSGCGNSPSGTESGTKKVIDIKYAGIQAGISGFIPAVISKFGLDEANGMKWNITYMESAQATRTLISGQSDVGIIGAPAILTAQKQLPTIRVIRPLYWMHGSLLAKTGSGYSSLASLRGKKIVLEGPLGGIHAALELLTANEGMDLLKDFEVVEANPTIGLAAVDSDEAAATVAWVPITSRMLGIGDYEEVVNVRKVWKDETGEDMVNGVVITSQAWLDKNPEGSERIKSTLADATKYISDHPELFDDPDMQEVLGITAKSEVDDVRKAVLSILVPQWTDADTKVQIDIAKKLMTLENFPKLPDDKVAEFWSNAGVE